jgi:hypothetical protein
VCRCQVIAIRVHILHTNQNLMIKQWFYAQFWNPRYPNNPEMSSYHYIQRRQILFTNSHFCDSILSHADFIVKFGDGC